MAKQLLPVFIYFLLNASVNPTPKIILLGSYPLLNETEASNGIKTYTFPHFAEKTFPFWVELGCESEEPNRWIIWNANIVNRNFEVEKSVKRRLNSSTYVSYLNWPRHKFSEIYQNVSCLYEKDWKSVPSNINLKSFNLTTPAAMIKGNSYSNGERNTLIIYDYQPLGYYYTNPTSHYNDTCLSNLTIDLTSRVPVAICRSNLHSPMLKYCDNSDMCDSLSLSNVPPASYNCDGDFDNLKDTSGELSLSFSSPPKPLIVYCQAKDDEVWSSFMTIYPAVERENWSRIMRGKIIDNAVNENSIQVTLYKYWPSGKNWHFNTSMPPLTFAINETVEFACLAVKSLYMKTYRRGFEWKLGSSIVTPDESTQMYEFNVGHSLYFERRNITFHEEYKSFNTKTQTISCQGPVWNSKRMQSSYPLTYVLRDPVAPTGFLTHKVSDDGHDEFTCNYQGWPKPKVTWFFSEQVFSLPGSPHQVDSFPYYFNSNWDEIRSIITQRKPYNVSCILKNLKGEFQQSITKYEGYNSSSPNNDTVSDPTPSSDYSGLIIGTSILCIFIMILLVGFVIWRKYRSSPRSETILMTKPNSLVEDQYFNEDFELSIKDFSIDTSKLLGSGNFGTVHEGLVKGSAVAIKQPKSDYSKTAFKSILCELKVLSHLGTNENVVGFIGAYVKEIKEGYLLIAIELCTNGSLESHLRRKKTVKNGKFEINSENENADVLSYSELYRYSLEIASGMSYITSRNVIHGDLATRNVLLNHSNVCKITDFGLSRKLYEYQNYVKTSQEPLPWKWMAYESLTKMEFTSSSDMWSYGVTLWEIFSLGNVPYGGLNWTPNFAIELQQGLRLPIPEFSIQNMYDKMLKCWDINSDGRPTFSEMVEFFKQFHDVDYIELF